MEFQFESLRNDLYKDLSSEQIGELEADENFFEQLLEEYTVDFKDDD